MLPDGHVAPVRMVATDLDGTLLRTDHTISDRTLAAIQAADEAGVEVVAATGRGWRSAARFLTVAPQIRTAVLSNGALVRDLDRRVDLHAFPLDRDDLAATVATVRATVPEAGLFWESTDGWGYDAAYAAVRFRIFPHERPRADDPTPADPPETDAMLKVLVRHPGLIGEELLALLQPLLPDTVTVAFSGGPNLIEITGAGVHKARGLAALSTARGIDAENVLTVGDNHNDAEMLRWAGVGVAVANARPAAVEAADTRAPHHMDDGVAAVLEAVVEHNRALAPRSC